MVYEKISGAEAEQFYWKDTTRRSTYHEVVVGDEYLRLIDDLPSKIQAATDQSPAADAMCLIEGLTSVGVLQESPHRKSMMYVDGAGRKFLLTRWDFSSQGATVVVIKDFINAQVNGAPATLSLAVDLQRRPGLWKLNWVAGGRQFEFYVTVVSGENARQTAELIKRFGSLVKC